MGLVDTYQEFVESLRHLVLGAGNGYYITCHLGAGKIYLAVPFLLELVDFGHLSYKLPMVQAVDDDGLGDKLRVLDDTMSDRLVWRVCGRRRGSGLVFIRFTYHFLNHVHDFLLDEIETLCIARGGAADDIVHLDIIVLLANSAAVHCIGEFDEDRVLLHDALDVLATNANDTLVVLIRDMERY